MRSASAGSNIRKVAFPLGLGLVQGEIGVAQQFVGPTSILKRDRDADAHADMDELPVEQEGAVDGFDDPGRHVPRARLAAGIEKENGELVAAEARDDILLRDDGGQACGDLAEEFVPHAVAEGIVDEFEAIQIEHQHGENRWPAHAGRRHGGPGDRRTAPGSAGR